jgi:hypothetical protein
MAAGLRDELAQAQSPLPGHIGGIPDDGRSRYDKELVGLLAAFRDAEFRYWVAGGWALSLFRGEQIRDHSDLDVLVLVRDLDGVRKHFVGHDLVVQNPNTGETREWPAAEQLVAGRDVLVLSDDRAEGVPPVQILLGESDDEEWVFHRGRGTIRRPLGSFGRTDSGIPYVSPEVALLFKSRDLREKDRQDFEKVVHLLDEEQRLWLYERIEPLNQEHPWLGSLKS